MARFSRPGWRLCPEDEGRDPSGGVTLHVLERVTVDVEREAHGCVSESFRDDLGVDAGLKGKRCVSVPEVVQPDVREVALTNEPCEPL